MTDNLPSSYQPPSSDDGFGDGSFSSIRVGGSFLNWSDHAGWTDRDGMTPRSPVLVVAVDDLARMWKDGKPQDITAKPLPDLETLNATIPDHECDRGLDGQPRKWRHAVRVFLVDPATGRAFVYTADTYGAHIAWEQLREAVIVQRALRGCKCLPLVTLDKRPMKTGYGTRSRPHFEIVGWKTPPSDGEKAVPAEPTPQLSGGSSTPSEGVPTSPDSASAPPDGASASPEASANPQPKRPVNVGAETLAAMSDVKPATFAELMNDDIPHR
jgi:hypothetical protein